MNRVQSLGDFEGQFQEIINNALDKRIYATTTTPGADVEFAIEHGLNYVPNGFIVIDIDKAGIVYRGTTAWANDFIHLKCSAATAAIRIMIF